MASIALSAERRAALQDAVERFYRAEFDEPISEFRVTGLIDFFIRELGPPIYNQGVHDAIGYVQDRLVDLEGDVLAPESPPRG